jgi:signal transduction histidine kinase
MALQRIVKNILIGAAYISSLRDFKYAMLRGQFTLIVMLVSVFYISLDFFNGVSQFIPWYLLLFGLATGILVLNRLRYYGVATIVLLIVINGIVYLFADADIPQGGVFFYFMTCSILGLILGAYYSTSIGFFFAVLPIGLACVAYFFESNIMPPPSYEPVMIQINFMANIVIGITSNIIVVYFLISRNRESEQSLRDSEQHSIKIANEISEKNVQLAKTNEELDRFVYSASHDMRAPLSSLLGLINLSEKATSAEELKTYLEFMKGRIQTMDGFIREITDYSRNSRTQLEFESVQLNKIIQEAIDNLSYIDINRKIKIEIDSSCNQYIKTDVNRFTVIINNLLSNAYRYHNYNQEAPFIQFTAERRDGFVFITVRDNGWGISEEHQKKIFDMFYRASEISAGSGLGLYIVKETLEKLGGTITVNSSPGVGSAFTFSIPT